MPRSGRQPAKKLVFFHRLKHSTWSPYYYRHIKQILARFDNAKTTLRFFQTDEKVKEKTQGEGAAFHTRLTPALATQRRRTIVMCGRKFCVLAIQLPFPIKTENFWIIVVRPSICVFIQTLLNIRQCILLIDFRSTRYFFSL